jgi:hypothetical protein
MTHSDLVPAKSRMKQRHTQTSEKSTQIPETATGNAAPNRKEQDANKIKPLPSSKKGKNIPNDFHAKEE